MQANRRKRINAGGKEQSLKDGCILYSQHQGHELDEVSLFAYFILRLMPSSNPVQMTTLWGYLCDGSLHVLNSSSSGEIFGLLKLFYSQRTL
ncbi:hypothetical protein TNCV_2836401 [Trichonephila clavipes]|nr:hypothetical protein TNCV_2836401 [Trichonephila clavipes]